MAAIVAQERREGNFMSRDHGVALPDLSARPFQMNKQPCGFHRGLAVEWQYLELADQFRKSFRPVAPDSRKSR